MDHGAQAAHGYLVEGAVSAFLGRPSLALMLPTPSGVTKLRRFLALQSAIVHMESVLAPCAPANDLTRGGEMREPTSRTAQRVRAEPPASVDVAIVGADPGGLTAGAYLAAPTGAAASTRRASCRSKRT